MCIYGCVYTLHLVMVDVIYPTNGTLHQSDNT